MGHRNIRHFIFAGLSEKPSKTVRKIRHTRKTRRIHIMHACMQLAHTTTLITPQGMGLLII